MGPKKIRRRFFGVLSDGRFRFWYLCKSTFLYKVDFLL